MAPITSSDRRRPITDYERWLNPNLNFDSAIPPRYGPDSETYHQLDTTPGRFHSNHQQLLNRDYHRPSLPHTPGYPHHRHRYNRAYSQGFIRGITFFSAVLVVVIVVRMFLVSLIRASRQRREEERRLQTASQQQSTEILPTSIPSPPPYAGETEMNEL